MSNGNPCANWFVFLLMAPVLLCGASAAQTLQIGSLQTPPGQVRSGFLAVPSGPDGQTPFAGEVLYIISTPPISAGEHLAFIGATTAVEMR